jgi:hypothetical protein
MSNIFKRENKMKKLINDIILMMTLCVAISSCKKDEEVLQAPATLTIVNGIAGITPLVTNFHNDTKLDYYKTAQQIAAYASVRYTGYVGDYNLGLYRLTDTTKVYYQYNLNLEQNSIKSLYLAGTVAEPESFITSEKIPIYKPDENTIGIRFVNLSKGSGLVNVVLRTPSKILVTNIDYKGVTDFQSVIPSVPVGTGLANSIFDFKDAVTGVTIASYTFSYVATTLQPYLNRNITVVLRGVRGATGTSAPGAFQVDNF